MNLKKRILSLMMAILLVFNCLPSAYAARGDLLTLTDDILNLITDVEYGSAGETYQFGDNSLNGIALGDEVYLVADAVYDTTEVGRAKVILTNFRLEGADAAFYMLPIIEGPVEKQINITQKVIKIAPAKSYIYYGQDKPYFINEIADYSDQIVGDDIVNLTAEFGIEPGDAVKSDYSIWINGEVVCDNEKYTAKLDETIKFEVREYETLANAETVTNDYTGVKKAILSAPDGFLISKDNQKDSLWTSSIEIDLWETQNGTAAYYLRRNDSSDTEYNQAISKEKIYNYTSVQTLPEIESIKIEKMNDSVLNFLPFGVFGNGSVNVTVKAIGTTVEQETTIYLGEDESYESKIATPELGADGKYHYTAVFTYDVPKNANLKAYAVNSSGESDKYAKLTGVNDIDGSDTTIDAKPFMLEEKLPEIAIGTIDSNYKRIKCDIVISDIDSGIAKVEYGWDLDESLCDYDQNRLSGHYLGFRQNGYTSEYVDYNGFDKSNLVHDLSFSLELKYLDSVWAKDNRHTVYIRVTDNAGNVSCYSLHDPIGSDMSAPNVTSVEIRKAEVSAVESVLRFFTFGSFSNDSVEIAIIANDNESMENLYASGVKRVTVNDRIMTKNDAGEYILTVSPDDMMETMQITVEDNAGWTTTAAVTNIPDEGGYIKNNDLIVENNKPEISLNFSFGGYADSAGKVWYGAGDALKTLEIAASDKGKIKSGLYSLKITDNGVTLFEKTGFSSIETEHSESYIIGNLADGEHTIVVTAEDNAGNIKMVSKTFYIDCDPPESGMISAISPESINVDGKQWFDKEEIITFRVDSSDAASGIKRISMKINGRSFEFVDDKILSDEKGNYVIVDTANLNPDAEHKYTVTGVVTDVANNSLNLEPIVIYKDFENPSVNKFTVENKYGILGKILNVLTFGAYANDTLILKAYVSDAKFDSGIDYVTVEYEGLSAPEKMIAEGEGIYSAEISTDKEVFESDIIVTAYDKYGKKSITCPNLVNAENGASSNSTFVMIETVKPLMTLNLPTGDGVVRTDGQTWYKSNKTIEFKVQDNNSGIRDIDFTVNDIDIICDKNGVDLLKTAVTEAADARNTEEQYYVFDTDYITAQAGESADGKYLINIKITDNAGNVKVYATAYYLDKIDPKIDKVEFTPSTADEVKDTAEFVEEFEYGFYFKTDFIATIHVSDELPSSGLNEIQYRFVSYQDGEKKTEISGAQKILDGTAKLTVPKGFKGQIFVEAFDNVSNCSGEKTTKAYVVDDVAPDINVIKNVTTSYHDAVGNNLYVEDNSITIEVTDTVSGIKEIAYSQSSELNSYERKTIAINSNGYKIGDDLGDGWTVSAVDVNLVTKVTKTFVFGTDDNDVVMTFDATDNAINKRENVKSEKFTVDKTSPIINVSFRNDEDGDVYYAQNRIADVTVIDRNFDANLIKVAIENKFGAVPSFSFTEKSKTEHVAVIDFGEGDYTFDVTGTDLGNHVATVNFSGGNEKLFFVDKTIPGIEENFGTFTNVATESSFNIDKTVTIKITEHNFDPELVNLRILKKDAGANHNSDGFEDATYEMGGARWESSGDVHTISFTLSQDAVYQVEITPTDLAGNAAERRSTVVFEIDKTVPVVKSKNGMVVSPDNTECLDIYSYLRANDPIPTVEFDDLNISYIKYVLTVYNPDYTSTEATTIIRPVRVYLKEDANKTGKIEGNKVVLPEFVKDGIYALELIAVDVAGNESLLNVNTYVRMVDQDVLAYVMDSNLAQKTGLYSFQYENGDAISKRPDNFDDIKIFVLAKKDTDVDIVLRDNNGNEFNTNAQATIDDSVYGMEIYNFTLSAAFFKENFQDDMDSQLYLTVKNEGNRIDLGEMHIDNIAPTCDVPKDFRAWRWYYGEEARTITVSNINELIDESQCKVYDNGKEIPFTYSSEENTIVFTLEKGWHNVGIIINDMAGNAYNMQERVNIHIGFFWLWIIIAISASATGVMIYVIIRNKRKRTDEKEE